MQIGSSDCAGYDRRLDRIELASILDTDGYISCTRHSKAGDLQILTGLGMTNSYYPLLFYKRYEGSYYIAPPTQGRKLEVHCWRVNGQGCEDPLRDALPYLRVKYDLAKLALMFVKTVRPHTRTSDRDLLLRERIYELMRPMQLKKGPGSQEIT